jgi:hypothetical protein
MLVCIFARVQWRRARNGRLGPAARHRPAPDLSWQHLSDLAPGARQRSQEWLERSPERAPARRAEEAGDGPLAAFEARPQGEGVQGTRL